MRIYKTLGTLSLLSALPLTFACSTTKQPFLEPRYKEDLNDKKIVDDDWDTNYPDINDTEPIDRLVTLSSNQKNILLFFSDEVTGRVVSQYLKEDRDNITSNFTGATVYRNVVSSNFTNVGVPRINGGWDFNIENQTLGSFKRTMNKEVIVNSYERMVNMMNKYGYQQQWHDLQYFKDRESASYFSAVKPFYDHFDNIEEISATASPDVTKYYSDVPNEDEKGWHSYRQWDSLFAKQAIAKHLTVKKTKKPIFKWICGEATHTSFKYQNNTLPEDTSGYSNYGSKISDESTFTDIRNLSDIIKKLKAKKIYDDTMIIYVSDHGSRSYIGEGDYSSREANGLVPMVQHQDYNDFLTKARSWFYTIWPRKNNGQRTDDGVTSRFFRTNASLIVKPWNSHGNIKFDDTTLLGNADVPAIIKHEIQTKQYPGKPYDFNLSRSLYPSTYNLYSDDPLGNEKHKSLEVYPSSDWKERPDDWHPGNNRIKLKISGDFWNENSWQYADFGTQNWKDFP